MITAVIIGAGSIGGGGKSEDVDNIASYKILSHAHACVKHSDIKLLGIVDIDVDKAKKAGERWGVPGYENINQVPEYADIIICAVPTDRHLISLLEISKYKPRLVIAEKPFCKNVTEAGIVKAEYDRLEIPIAIDYIRRYVEVIRKLKCDLDNNYYGEIYNVSLKYTRGIFHEACHFMDLCRFFLGEYKSGIYRDDDICDNYPENTVSAMLHFQKCERVFLLPCDGRAYCVFEIEIMTEKGKISLVDNGNVLEFYGLIKSEYGDYESLSSDYTYRQDTGLYTALSGLMDNAVNYLNGKEELLCTAEDALAVHRIYDNLMG